MTKVQDGWVIVGSYTFPKDGLIKLRKEKTVEVGPLVGPVDGVVAPGESLCLSVAHSLNREGGVSWWKDGELVENQTGWDLLRTAKDGEIAGRYQALIEEEEYGKWTDTL